jgi:hypothetical protein
VVPAAKKIDEELLLDLHMVVLLGSKLAGFKGLTTFT